MVTKYRDKFILSDGNLKVLETIPKMMKIHKYRKELRALTLKFLFRKDFKRRYGENNDF